VKPSHPEPRSFDKLRVTRREEKLKIMDKSGIDQLLEIMARLRGPGGCPWDQEQTHESIKPQLIEECYEVVEAIESGQPEHLREELGDLLLHVVFHAQMAQEKGEYTFDQVARGIVEKLIRRHPHVFGDQTAADSAEVLKNWHEIKKKEKPERMGALDGVPRGLPGLMRAQELQRKAARVGFDWPDIAGPMAKIQEETVELQKECGTNPDSAKIKDELGDLLFAVVNVARHLKIDAEEALGGANAKFQNRFQAVEAEVKAQGKEMKDCALAELDAIWDRVKRKG
jgi:MazG family protein